MNVFRLHNFGFLLMVCLTGCAVSNGKTQAIHTPEYILTSTLRPSSTIISTTTPFEETQESTNISQWPITVNCPKELSFNKNTTFPGRLIFTRSEFDGFWYLGVDDSEPILLTDFSTSLRVSPGGDYLALQNDDNPQIITITDELGTVINTLTLQENPIIFLDSWFTDEWLKVNTQDIHPFSIMLLSPLTGQIEQYNPQLPDTYIPIEEYYATSTFSPDLTQVIYTQLSADTYTLKFVLWDINLEKKLWSSNYDIEETHSLFSFPAWSTDGDAFVITDQNTNEIFDMEQDYQDIFIISKDGRILFSTLLQEKYGRHWISQQPMWSPDNRLIAFWVLPLERSPNERLYRLLIIDTTSGHVTDFCLENDRIPEMAWSPNSQYLAVITGVSNIYNLVVVDLNQGNMFTILADEQITNIIGWTR